MRSVITVVFVATMATGCVGEEPNLSMSTQGVLEGNKIISNKIISNRLQLNKIISNKIISNKLSNFRYRIAANDLMSTADGREVLDYVVSCAIPSGVTLEGRHAGVTYEFHGGVGLAPRWLDRALREGEQRWVSACLISRVNRFGIPVEISIRGPHDALVVSTGEAQDFTREEGAFFGNVFTPINEPIIWNACRGRNEASSESGDLDLRDCAEPDPANPGFTLCGFNYVGDCQDWTPPSNAYACKKFQEPRSSDDCGDHDDDHEGGYYEKCYDEAGRGHWPHAERFDEVITVFVQP
jgi:hypothetical protein